MARGQAEVSTQSDKSSSDQTDNLLILAKAASQPNGNNKAASPTKPGSESRMTWIEPIWVQVQPENENRMTWLNPTYVPPLEQPWSNPAWNWPYPLTIIGGQYQPGVPPSGGKRRQSSGGSRRQYKRRAVAKSPPLDSSPTAQPQPPAPIAEEVPDVVDPELTALTAATPGDIPVTTSPPPDSNSDEEATIARNLISTEPPRTRSFRQTSKEALTPTTEPKAPKSRSGGPTGGKARNMTQITPLGPNEFKLVEMMWSDMNTKCYLVEVDGCTIARRADNDTINGTKLLNYCKVSRGKRDCILKHEWDRDIVRYGPSDLMGIWVSIVRAREIAVNFQVEQSLFPLFENVIEIYVNDASNVATKSMETTVV